MPILKEDHPAVTQGRTLFTKSIKSPKDLQVLKPGNNNTKLGYLITKGKWKGKAIYSLTLEERKTCPETCHHWTDCYGNNLYLAHRFQHGQELEDKLLIEVPKLLEKHPQGIVVRLHVLGDFYSLKYVRLWKRLLKYHKNLCVFGYTARYNEPIGDAIHDLNTTYPDRCCIRYSRNKNFLSSKQMRFAANEDFNGKYFICPIEDPKVNKPMLKCNSCAACWTAKKTVKFLNH